MSDTAWPAGRYRLREQAYIGLFPGDDHRIREPGTEIMYDGKPGPHMEPLDDAAREAVDRAGTQVLNFTNVAPMTVGDENDALAERTAVAVTKALTPLMALLGQALGVQQTAPAAPRPIPEPELGPVVVPPLQVPTAEIVAPPPPLDAAPPAPPLPPRPAPKR